MLSLSIRMESPSPRTSTSSSAASSSASRSLLRTRVTKYLSPCSVIVACPFTAQLITAAVITVESYPMPRKKRTAAGEKPSGGS